VDKIPDATDVTLWGRPELAAVCRESTGRPYNEKVYGQAFFVNARARPTLDLLSRASSSEPFVALAGKELVAARLDAIPLAPGVVTKSAVSSLAKKVKSHPPPPGPLFAGYWDLVESNGLAIADQARRFEDPLPLPRSVEVRGPSENVMVDGGAEVEGSVTFDARLGPIIIEKGAAVESFSRVMGPCYVGQKAKILSALIGGGTSIFESCKVGGQVENSIFSPFTNKAHHGYVGDAYVGSWVNLGAGCTFSNLKNTYGNVRPEIGGKKQDSGMVKLGPVIGDMAKLSIGSMVYAGKAVGTGSHVSGLAAENVPSFTYYGSTGQIELKLESVMLTQRRMMERRGMAPSRAEESLVRKAFLLTAAERRRAGVKKGVIR
jgi:UDP-N-acetylglucosamine diphosphorylase / glucose-1-phosphate thymidylyltransferase / UDP-N-acetylgalactosamine diphosphorylase / glucosamine-1-phosphate N-acetyltransferase / galactosamine-1-phosphate N-acetyltransferase